MIPWQPRELFGSFGFAHDLEDSGPLPCGYESGISLFYASGILLQVGRLYFPTSIGTSAKISKVPPICFKASTPGGRDRGDPFSQKLSGRILLLPGIMLPVAVQSKNEQSIERLLPCRKNMEEYKHLC
eukprot:symbB.v1.2.035322.t1/scaffold4588.1/size37650/2